MINLKLLLIFAAGLALDGLILPAFFGFKESFLSLLILVMPVLYMGSTGRLIAYGIVFALISESWRGLNFGDMAIPFLFTAAVINLIQHFLDIKYAYLIALMSVMSVYIFLFFYAHGSINMAYFDPVIGLTMILEALILVFVFNVIFNKQTDYVS